jgi:menaquinone-9 beta-reductase
MRDVVIIGGGLAGLVSALQLSQAGLNVLVVEKKAYPFHKVCGEYISNEVLPLLKSLQIDPFELNPAHIDQFMLTTTQGRSLQMPLDMGGFGLSRYAFDHYLHQKALECGVDFKLFTEVQTVTYSHHRFNLQLSDQTEVFSRLVIGAHGKRARIDKHLNRKFFQQRSPWIGVKYHIRADLPDNAIALHNFPGGYCGISKIEGDRHNLCYLSRRENLRDSGNIAQMEAEVLCKNPYLKEIFSTAEFVYDKPLVINEVSFNPKSAVENHVLMAGDSAGMITPLCGNGMAMAMHSAKILSDIILKYYRPGYFDRQKLEDAYHIAWHRKFGTRMWYGRQIQRFFGSGMLTESSIALGMKFPPFARFLMKQTHGEVINE